MKVGVMTVVGTPLLRVGTALIVVGYTMLLTPKKGAVSGLKAGPLTTLSISIHTFYNLTMSTYTAQSQHPPFPTHQTLRAPSSLSISPK
jgi:hypothetical protein